MIKVYFTASTSVNGQFGVNYRRIISCLKKAKVSLVSGEQIISPVLLDQDKRLTKQAIFKRERRRIDQADLVVAEVTRPSTGVGGEVVYALTRGKPVLALVFAENDDKLSPMIEGNPSDYLFLEHYHLDNLHLVIKSFLGHVRELRRRKGILIVVDGADGAGKTTQAELLIKYLRRKKIPVKYVDFPRYYSSFHGKTIARFLRGEFGSFDQVSPYLVSLAYALDRAAAKEEMEEFLRRGGVIVANRYTTSNMAHQTARLPAARRPDFLKWVTALEYKIHKIPREDLVIYLYVPWRKSIRLTQKKPIRNYLAGQKADLAERDIDHRIAAEKMYLTLASAGRHWVKINCLAWDKLLPPQAIHRKVIQTIRKRFSYL